MTRAKERLFLSYALANTWGQPASCSAFLQEVTPAYLEIMKSEDLLKDIPNPLSTQTEGSEPSLFTTAGDLIRKEKETEAARKLEEYPILKSKFFQPSATSSQPVPAKSSIFKKIKETGWHHRGSQK